MFCQKIIFHLRCDLCLQANKMENQDSDFVIIISSKNCYNSYHCINIINNNKILGFLYWYEFYAYKTNCTG